MLMIQGTEHLVMEWMIGYQARVIAICVRLGSIVEKVAEVVRRGTLNVCTQ